MAARPYRNPLINAAAIIRSGLQHPTARSYRLLYTVTLLLGAQSALLDYLQHRSVHIGEVVVRVAILSLMFTLCMLVTNRIWPEPSVAASLGTYVAAGLLHLLLIVLGLDPASLLTNSASVDPWRVWFGFVRVPIIWVIWMTASAVAAEQSARTVGLFPRLAQARLQLSQELTDARDRAADLAAEFRTMVDEVLLPKVAALRLLVLENTPQSLELSRTADEIRRFCREQVRTASHRMYLEQGRVEGISRDITLLDLARLRFPHPRLLTGQTFALVGTAVVPPIFMRYGGPVAFTVAVVILVVGLLGWAMSALTESIPSANIGSLFSASLAAILGLSLLARSMLLSIPDLTVVSYQTAHGMHLAATVVPFVAVVVWALVGVSGTWNSMNATMEAELQNINARIDIVIASSNAADDAERKRLALLLHGAVQGRLAAAAFSLDQAKNDGGDQLGNALRLLDQVKQDLDQAFEAPSTSAAVSVEARIAQLKADWEGILEIEFDLERESIVYLDGFPRAADNFVRTVEESASNALQHGGASWLKVRMRALPDGMELLITNNSSQHDEMSVPGIGLAELRRRGVEVETEWVDGNFQLRAKWSGTANTPTSV